MLGFEPLRVHGKRETPPQLLNHRSKSPLRGKLIFSSTTVGMATVPTKNPHDYPKERPPQWEPTCIPHPLKKPFWANFARASTKEPSEQAAMKHALCAKKKSRRDHNHDGNVIVSAKLDLLKVQPPGTYVHQLTYRTWNTCH